MAGFRIQSRRKAAPQAIVRNKVQRWAKSTSNISQTTIITVLTENKRPMSLFCIPYWAFRYSGYVAWNWKKMMAVSKTNPRNTKNRESASGEPFLFDELVAVSTSSVRAGFELSPKNRSRIRAQTSVVNPSAINSH